MNAISTLTILPETKQEIESYVLSVKQNILNGYINPLSSAIMLKSLEEIIKLLRSDEDIKQYIDSEFEKHGTKDVEFQGAKISKSSRKSFDFSTCDDEVINDLIMKKNQLDAEIKGREAWLKTIKEPTPDVNTGLIINPPAYTSIDILSISLKK